MMFVRIIAFALLLLPQAALAQPERLLVFAAASMREALEAAAVVYEADCRCKIVYSFASSSILARQIDAGAPAAVYISANETWIEWLDQRDRLGGSAVTIASNALVIVVSAYAAPTQSAQQILRTGKFAMGDPSGVPAGVYAKAALETLKMWEAVKSNAVFSENVRVALGSVAQGSLKAGIVYQSDLRVETRVKVHYRFDTATHPPIRYVAAIPKTAGPEAGTFLEFLTSPGAQQVFLQFGLLPPRGEVTQ